MIPSLVASEVEVALRDFLSTQFRPSNPELSDIIENFLAERKNLLKGPYLSIDLPFQRVPGEGEPYPEIPLEFVPYRHQRTAFERLSQRRSTVVATGTGSGKTECFLYPILEWCRQQSGKPGIKAILIYPMNALATDQAGRIAKLVHSTPSLRSKVTAGIYIGQGARFRHDRMTAKSIIANRETLVERPPDILLTNYKMLDYLLSRPKDQRLWRKNGPDTLQWLVVDELHTFDGAQGTDLACLIRRLKARLGATGRDLTCVGTSATLGEADEEDQREYVAEVFGTPFEPGSIVGETRQNIDELLGHSFITDHLIPPPDLADLVDHRRFDSTEDYIRAQYELFFGEQPGTDFLTDAWKVALAERLRGHSTFRNLLTALELRPKSLRYVVDCLARTFRCRNDEEACGILNGLCALISVARIWESSDTSPNLRPFLPVSLHLWVRELGRMVCSVSEPETQALEPVNHRPEEEVGHAQVGASNPASSGPPDSESRGAVKTVAFSSQPVRRLRHSDDLGPDEPSIYLPLVQCHSCRVSGWGAVLDLAGGHVRKDLRHFYNHFFARDVDVQFLFPARKPLRSKGHTGSVCGACGSFRLGDAKCPCSECESDQVVEVFIPDSVVEERKQGRKRRVLSLECPYCSADDALFIFGARSTVLLSVALGQTYSSRHNDDRKVIAFSDNVQDAAHRAGFFSHRTWRNSKRAAIAQAVPKQDGISLADLPGSVIAKWSKVSGAEGGFDTDRFVEEFIAPDRTWLRDFKDFQRHGRLPRGSRLPSLVTRRLEWEALAEVGFGAPVAHSLQRARAAVAGPNLGNLHSACKAALLRLREEISELNEIEIRQVRWIALGVLRRMQYRGAIFSDSVEGIKGFLASGCSRWNLTRNLALQEFGPGTPHPVFPSDPGFAVDADGIEPLTRAGGSSWYQRWVEKVLRSQFALLSAYHLSAVLEIVLESLKSRGLTKIHQAKGIPVWGVDPEQFHVTRKIGVLRGASPTRELVVPRKEAPLWLGAPCLELGVAETYQSAVPKPPTWAGRIYLDAQIRRVVAEEHTALLTREKRELIQSRFSAERARPGDPNMLSATPTLELGIDIGDLSTVALCSVPPTQANYLQRIGRAGRRDGNAFTVTLASAKPHDLFFYAEPLEMLDGAITPPGVFLNASAVLERQLTSFCLDNWAAACHDPNAVPRKIHFVLENVQARTLSSFPFTFFAYTSKKAKRLLRGFLQAFEGSLSDESKRYLRVFLMGEQGEVPRLERRILDRLNQVVKERNSIRRERERLGQRIRDIRRDPQDQSTEADIKQLNRERAGLSKLLRKINNRDTFGFLTDEGLIPNYAFPEEGVTLRSVILRRPSIEEAGQGVPSEELEDLESYEYLRSASAALSEFAPSSRFYAGGHRVEIDRVDLDVTSIEKWRLCPSCTHCRCIDEKDDLTSCPRCGDPMWADAGQARLMLPLRLVYATTPAKRAQIMDDRDNRESIFFTRHLVADFEPSSERRAYAVPPPGIPFAFEYAARTTFREMNFGWLNSKGQPTKFAGRALPREGFRVCRHCGKVQSRLSNAPAEHTVGCRKAQRKAYATIPDTAGFGDSDAPRAADPAIVDCLYLYREFQSESLRMLIPVVEEEGIGPRVQSFIAAVELGLREKFGGRIDHLRVMTDESPDPNRNFRRKYLVLYDTVPGGTGYLKQLAHAPAEIVAVFQVARNRLLACDCDDGCYRCVFAYRRSREMARTSKRLAIKLLDQVMEHAHGLKPVDFFDEVEVDWLIESDLEARFIRALEERANTSRELKLHKATVRGKDGYLLSVGQETWHVEPQAYLNQSDAVAAASRPDFLLHRSKASDSIRPVAVFLDGFQYHKNSTDDDSLKRMALIRGKYVQWSLTWHDLAVALGGTADAPDLIRGGGPPNDMKQLQDRLDATWSVGPLRARLRESSFDLLLLYLGEPDPAKWKQAVFTEALRLFQRSNMMSPSFQSRLQRAAKDVLPPQAQDAFLTLASRGFVACRGTSLNSGFDMADLFAALPKAAIIQADPNKMSVALHLHDQDPNRKGYREIWNGVLRLFNLIQFLPNSWWTTSRAVTRGLYPEFASEAASHSALSSEWTETIEDADKSVRNLLAKLALLDAPVPDEVGYELTNSTRGIIAEAEIAWKPSKIALLRIDQECHAKAFKAAGWRVWMPGIQTETIRSALIGNTD